MFNLTILAVGKIKEKYFQEAIAEYLKRLAPYAKIKIEEVKAEPFKRESDKAKVKSLEAQRLLQYLQRYPESDAIIMDERGRQYDSVEFSNFLSRQRRPLIFIIGGSLGLGETIQKLSADKISLSPLTLPHELARLVLIEQLYRAATIIQKKDYHH